MDDKVAGEFLDKLIKAMAAVSYGDPAADPNPDMSCQVSLDQLEKVEAMVERAKQDGAEVPDRRFSPQRYQSRLFLSADPFGQLPPGHGDHAPGNLWPCPAGDDCQRPG